MRLFLPIAMPSTSEHKGEEAEVNAGRELQAPRCQEVPA